MIHYLRNGFCKNFIPMVVFFLILIITEIVRFSFGTHFTLAPLFFAIVTVSIFSNIPINIILSAIMFAYSLYVTLPNDPVRAAIVIISFSGIVILIYYLRTKSERYDNAEKLIHKMQVAHSLFLSLLVNWPDWDDGQKWDMCQKIHEEINDIMMLSRGWAKLDELRKKEQSQPVDK